MTLLTSSFLLGLVLAPVVPAIRQGGTCPDQKATLVKGRTASQGGSNCTKGLTLFGAQLGSVGKRCPAIVIQFPEHGACLGESAEDYRCVKVGAVSITARRCACLELGFKDTSFGFDKCVCGAPVAIGGLIDARTVSCQGSR